MHAWDLQDIYQQRRLLDLLTLTLTIGGGHRARKHFNPCNRSAVFLIQSISDDSLFLYRVTIWDPQWFYLLLSRHHTGLKSDILTVWSKTFRHVFAPINYACLIIQAFPIISRFIYIIKTPSLVMMNHYTLMLWNSQRLLVTWTSIWSGIKDSIQITIR